MPRGREKGWHHTEEVKEKIRQSRLEWWAAKKKAEAYAEEITEQQTTLPKKRGFWARLFG